MTAASHPATSIAPAQRPADADSPLTTQAVLELFELPFPELAFRAQQAHRAHHDPTEVQLATLCNIKQGGCPEDCGYCSQSARHSTGLTAEPLMPTAEVLAMAEQARARGATRFCMGAAWRKVRDGKDFDRVLDMVRGVVALEMEACVTLGMLTPVQAERLAEAGLTAYNHNIDTSPEYYDRVITTRRFSDRLETVQNVRDAGITVCCGGIVGLGESREDRASMLRVLASMDPQPESVPINALVRVEGTPLGAGATQSPPLDNFELLRTVAVARILMPESTVRLSAGRRELGREGQALALLCGANSIFYGSELLTTPNPERDEDRELLQALGMRPTQIAGDVTGTAPAA